MKNSTYHLRKFEIRHGIGWDIEAKAAIARAKRTLKKAFYAENRGGHLTTKQRAYLAITEASHALKGRSLKQKTSSEPFAFSGNRPADSGEWETPTKGTDDPAFMRNNPQRRATP